jgi:hypothetical protein
MKDPFNNDNQKGCFSFLLFVGFVVVSFVLSCWAITPPKGYHRGYRGWVKDPPLVYDWNWEVKDGKVIYK